MRACEWLVQTIHNRTCRCLQVIGIERGESRIVALFSGYCLES